MTTKPVKVDVKIGKDGRTRVEAKTSSPRSVSGKIAQRNSKKQKVVRRTP